MSGKRDRLKRNGVERPEISCHEKRTILPSKLSPPLYEGCTVLALGTVPGTTGKSLLLSGLILCVRGETAVSVRTVPPEWPSPGHSNEEEKSTPWFLVSLVLWTCFGGPTIP